MSFKGRDKKIEGDMFKGMDTDNSGTITLEELKQGLSKQGTKLSEYEVKQLMEAISQLLVVNIIRHRRRLITSNVGATIIHATEYMFACINMLIPSLLCVLLFPWMKADADVYGTINYDEFITATMHMNRMDKGKSIFTLPPSFSIRTTVGTSPKKF